RFIKSFDARSEGGVAQDENRRAVLARDPRRFDRDIETIFDCRCCEHDARAVAMSAINRLMQIALLDIRRQTCARSAALNITNNERDLGHGGPADRFGLE